MNHCPVERVPTFPPCEIKALVISNGEKVGDLLIFKKKGQNMNQKEVNHKFNNWVRVFSEFPNFLEIRGNLAEIFSVPVNLLRGKKDDYVKQILKDNDRNHQKEKACWFQVLSKVSFILYTQTTKIARFTRGSRVQSIFNQRAPVRNV